MLLIVQIWDAQNQEVTRRVGATSRRIASKIAEVLQTERPQRLCRTQARRRHSRREDKASFKLDTKRMGTPSGGRCPLCAKSRPSAMQQKERFLAAVLLWQLSGLFQTRFERGEKARCFTSGDGAMIEGEG